MRLIDADKFLAYLIYSKHIDGLTCGEVREAIEMCKVDVLDKIRAEIEQIADEEQKHDEKWAIGLRYAVKIIDKYRGRRIAMTCDKCQYFKIVQEPLRGTGGLIDMGRAECIKHKLVTDFANHGQFRELICPEKAESEE